MHAGTASSYGPVTQRFAHSLQTYICCTLLIEDSAKAAAWAAYKLHMQHIGPCWASPVIRYPCSLSVCEWPAFCLLLLPG